MNPVEQRPPDYHQKNIVLVVGIDFSEDSGYALNLASKLVTPAQSSAEIHVIHATSPAVVPETLVEVLPSFGPGVSASIEGVRERLMKSCLELGRSTSARIVPHLVFGDAAAEIANLARDVEADLIVVGTRRRKGVAIAWHRSLSARLVRFAPCSVLTARPKEIAPEATIEPPCSDCLAVRSESAGKVFWCARHTGHHVHGHLHQGLQDSFVHSSWTFPT